MGLDVESQQTLDEVVDRTSGRISAIVASALGELGREVSGIMVTVQEERKALEQFISGLTVEITIPKIIIAVKTKEIT